MNTAAEIDAVEAQQIRLFRSIVLGMLAGIACTAPIFLLIIPWPAGPLIVGAQGLAAAFSAIALVQMRAAKIEQAILLATSGMLLALAILYLAFGLRASMPFLIVTTLPVAWATLLARTRFAAVTVGSIVGIVGLSALEGLGGVGFVAVPELPMVANVVTFTSITLIYGWFLNRSGQTLRNALNQTRQRQRELESLRDSLEATVATRTASLQTALDDVQAREITLAQTIAELRESQATIRELSAPVLPVLADVLVMPLIGAIDSTRASMIAEQVLRAVEQRRTRLVILDVTGLPIIDTHVARVLLETSSSLRLLGAQVALVGIRPEVAQTLVALQVDFGALTTYPDLREAITQALDQRS